MRYISCFMMFFFLSACSQEDILQKFSSPEEQATAKAYIDRLRARDFGALENATDKSIRGPDIHDALIKMADLIPAREPMSIKLVGAQTFHMSGATRVNTTFEYDFGGAWLLMNVAIQEKNGEKTIVGFNVNPEPQSLESQNQFTLFGKGVAQYVILATAILVILLTTYSLVACIRSKLPGRKWPWILFIVFGFGKIAINWTTGQLSITPVFVQLFSASAAAQFYGPWIVSVSIPVGAISFLLYRMRRMAAVAGG
ncbi:hypothetical protein SAMN04515618_1303 [Collimonas sp. OK307]|uniref:hypothetical protein n=1 Tax=Collimonas sp. OK307 TaxID=1801620 RepID=UPI0008EA1DFD|nr:hypothetical protein [Collimonas sp. OK307]SFI48570.1 hypothetical protein SAMN04515618_1303 [Collimonas sp. OK307]